MANCIFLRRRYADKGIPLRFVRYFSASGSDRWYVEINGVKYYKDTDLSTVPDTVKEGDVIVFNCPANYVYIDDVGTAQGATLTVTSSMKKIVIIMYYMSTKAICVSTNPNHVVGLYYGSGQTNNCYIALNNDRTNYNKYQAGYFHHAITLTSIQYGMKAGTNNPAIGTLDGVEVYRNTDTSGYGYQHAVNVPVPSGTQGVYINSSYNSSNYGGTLAVKTY